MNTHTPDRNLVESKRPRPLSDFNSAYRALEQPLKPNP